MKKKKREKAKTARVEAGSGEKGRQSNPPLLLYRARAREAASPPPPPVGVPPEGDEPTGHEDESQ